MTVSKIQIFLQLTRKKMEGTLASHETENIDVNDAAIGLVEAKRELSSMKTIDANDKNFMDSKTINLCIKSK